MGINFSNLSIPRTSKQTTDPIELFQSLKVNDSSINDLWLAQGDALREWHSKRTNEDTAIVLNTGAGKTLVGLLAAQSIVNETNEHVLYVCSSIQLIEQTAAKAKGYGLDVTTYFRSDFSNSLYQRCLEHRFINPKSYGKKGTRRTIRKILSNFLVSLVFPLSLVLTNQEFMNTESVF